MSEEKSTKARHEETDKILAETQRRIAESLSKKAGMTIEQIEKERKRTEILSLFGRIQTIHSNLTTSIKAFMNIVQPNLIFMEERMTEDAIDTYKSIRQDFLFITKIPEANFNKLFPERNTHFKTRVEAVTILISIREQVVQMNDYLMRYAT